MRFSVAGLVQEGLGAVRKVEVEGVIASEERPPERVVGTAELLRTKAGVLVRADLSIVEPEVCSRCLKPLEETVSIVFEEEFQTTVDPRGEAVTEAVDPEAFRVDDHHLLDLTEAVRQYREVSLLMQPLCSPGCRGLCPRCGSDLNLGGCDCQRGADDSRWAGLAALRGNLGERKD